MPNPEVETLEQRLLSKSQTVDAATQTQQNDVTSPSKRNLYI